MSGVWVARVVGVDTRVRGYDGWRDGAFLGVDWGARDDGWILEFEGEKIRESRHYFDMVTLLTQLGAMPQ